ncbi:hypothetical protein ABIC51_007647 [Burkholderia sp. 572]
MRRQRRVLTRHAVDGFRGEFGHGDQAVAVVQIAHGQLHRVEMGAAGAMRLANRATRSWRAPAGEWGARGPWNTGVRGAREDMPRKPLAGAGRRATLVAHGATVRPPGYGGRTWAPGSKVDCTDGSKGSAMEWAPGARAALRHGHERHGGRRSPGAIAISVPRPRSGRRANLGTVEMIRPAVPASEERQLLRPEALDDDGGA